MQSPIAARRYPDPAYPAINCVCTGDGCGGVTDAATCNGHPDADGGAHGAAALDLGSSAFNPSTITYLANCDPRCCNDAADCADPHCGSAANRTA